MFVCVELCDLYGNHGQVCTIDVPHPLMQLGMGAGATGLIAGVQSKAFS